MEMYKVRRDTEDNAEKEALIDKLHEEHKSFMTGELKKDTPVAAIAKTTPTTAAAASSTPKAPSPEEPKKKTHAIASTAQTSQASESAAVPSDEKSVDDAINKAVLKAQEEKRKNSDEYKLENALNK